MSTFISRMAMIDVSATASTATKIVIGRRMAVNTNHMRCLPEPLMNRSRLDLFDEGRQITVCLRRREQRAPDAEARDRIIGFGLCQQSLRFRDFCDARKAILVPSACLALTGSRGLALHRRVPGNVSCSLHERASLHLLGRQRLQ